jgi:adenylosuccinate synthase
VTHTVAVGLTWGDEGKGGLVDFLCSPYAAERARLVVRFNGGVNAGHNVVLADGRHHCFAQFGSGTLQGARTHLSRHMLLDPLALAAEATALTGIGVEQPYRLLTVDPRALIITPYHVAVNQQREQDRGASRHGSCGMGIWETAAFARADPGLALRAGHLTSLRSTANRLRDIRAALAAQARITFHDDARGDVRALATRYVRIARNLTQFYDRELLAGALEVTPAVFEGAQGVLLDQDYGTRPYVTGSTTTFANADELLTEAGFRATRLGVLRSYMTRHGAGPFPTETTRLNRDLLPEPHNSAGPWQGVFRWGDLDIEAIRYALEVCGGADALAITHCDAVSRAGLRLCTSYGPGRHWYRGQAIAAGLSRPVYETPAPGEFTGRVAELLGVPVTITSHGPTVDDKHAHVRAASR